MPFAYTSYYAQGQYCSIRRFIFSSKRSNDNLVYDFRAPFSGPTLDAFVRVVLYRLIRPQPHHHQHQYGRAYRPWVLEKLSQPNDKPTEQQQQQKKAKGASTCSRLSMFSASSLQTFIRLSRAHAWRVVRRCATQPTGGVGTGSLDLVSFCGVLRVRCLPPFRTPSNVA